MREHRYPGKFIVIEGIDGAGKTTQSRNISEALDAVYTHEPTDSKIGRKVGDMIDGDYSAEALVLSFAADRIVHLEDKVIPLLKEGKTVVSDRYVHSSIAYQKALGVEESWIREVNREALRPDRTFILDVDPETGLKRLSSRNEKTDFEKADFLEKVRENYTQMEGTKVDASGTVDEVRSRILEHLS